MATVDQLAEVLRRASVVCSSLYRGMGDTNALSFDDTKTAIVALSNALNALPEYVPAGQAVVRHNDAVPLTTWNGTAPQSGSITVRTYFAGDGTLRVKLPTNSAAINSGVVIPLVTGAAVKGVQDNTITKCTLWIDAGGVLQSATLAV